MKPKTARRTVGLCAWPELVDVCLGMRINVLAGLKTRRGFGPKIARSVDAQPDACTNACCRPNARSCAAVRAERAQPWLTWPGPIDRNLAAPLEPAGRAPHP